MEVIYKFVEVSTEQEAFTVIMMATQSGYSVDLVKSVKDWRGGEYNNIRIEMHTEVEL